MLFFLFWKSLKADFYFLQEMHALAADFNFWKNQWGDNIWMAYGNSNSAGVAIFVRLRQKERTQMQNGRSKDRFYFTVLQLL